MKKLIILTIFVLGNFSILLLSFLFLTIYTTKTTVALSEPPMETLNSSSSEISAYDSLPTIIKQTAVITTRDVRAEVVENYFKKYKSPMVGLGKDIVIAADKYTLPFGYLPAIGACEGALGQRIPANSFNTWGWGIYGGKIARFSSWQEAIETVSKGLSNSYFKLGLDTPEKIMAKYTPSSNGSWAVCVNKYLAELQ